MRRKKPETSFEKLMVQTQSSCKYTLSSKKKM